MTTMNSIYRQLLMLTIIFVGMASTAYSQDLLTVEILNKDTIVCDKADYKIRLKIWASQYDNITLKYSVNGKIYTTNPPIPYANIETNNGIYEIELDQELENGENVKHIEWKFINISAQTLGSYDKDLSHKVSIYATPNPDILTADKICGYDVELKANEKWSEISTYKWNVTNGDLSFADNANALLKLPTSTTETQYSTVTLTETTGGTCINSITKDLSILGRPRGSISTPEDIYICSVIKDNPEFTFDADFSIDGQHPIKYILSTGEEKNDVFAGETTHEVTMRQGGLLTIDSLIDKNGCVSIESELTGGINVIDRKPQLTAPNDTIPVEGLTFTLPISYGDIDNEKYIVLTEEYSNYDTHAYIEETESTVNAKVRSNMAGIHGFYYIETNNNGLACTDSIAVYADATIVVRNPDGFSPNGDGKNDYLVFEGLPGKNKLVVFNNKGEIVFEEENYRNRWQAEGLDDGYYIYVLEGQGMKTLKETLVIKRK